MSGMQEATAPEMFQKSKISDKRCRHQIAAIIKQHQ
jgi:hypothetical protein